LIVTVYEKRKNQLQRKKHVRKINRPKTRHIKNNHLRGKPNIQRTTAKKRRTKKHYKEKLLNLNQKLKSPKKINGEKITYIKNIL
jgi:hypothetical protein